MRNLLFILTVVVLSACSHIPNYSPANDYVGVRTLNSAYENSSAIHIGITQGGTVDDESSKTNLSYTAANFAYYRAHNWFSYGTQLEAFSGALKPDNLHKKQLTDETYAIALQENGRHLSLQGTSLQFDTEIFYRWKKVRLGINASAGVDAEFGDFKSWREDMASKEVISNLEYNTPNLNLIGGLYTQFFFDNGHSLKITGPVDILSMRTSSTIDYFINNHVIGYSATFNLSEPTMQLHYRYYFDI